MSDEIRDVIFRLFSIVDASRGARASIPAHRNRIVLMCRNSETILAIRVRSTGPKCLLPHRRLRTQDCSHWPRDMPIKRHSSSSRARSSADSRMVTLSLKPRSLRADGGGAVSPPSATRACVTSSRRAAERPPRLAAYRSNCARSLSGSRNPR